MTGLLVLVATPIGNLGDMSTRALETLRSADAIACEDTRRTRRLLTHFEIRGKHLLASHEHNEIRVAETVVGRISAGETIALVSDSGTPGISDPGRRVVEAVLAAGLKVSATPGASAVLSAVVVSGFDTDRFCFEGFLPRAGAERKARLAELANETRTSVVYESPNRVAKTFAQFEKVLGANRRAALVREFTKVHEEVLRGTLAELAVRLSDVEVKGECVIVIEGVQREAPELGDEELVRQLDDLRTAGASTKDAVAQVAAVTDTPRKRVYELATRKRP